jgi:hypothetical protein
MPGEKLAQGPRDALVEEDLHEPAATIADLDLSRSWRAISRLTEGKHSRNSERV